MVCGCSRPSSLITRHNFVEQPDLIIKNNELLNLESKDFSFEFWFKINSVDSGGTLIQSIPGDENFSISIQEELIKFTKGEYIIL